MEFKVGDRVKVIAETFSCTNEDIGKFGIIKEVDGNTYTTSIGNNLWHREDGLKKVSNFKEVSMKNATWAVCYDRNGDPTEYFKSKKDAEKRIQELLEEIDVDKKSIYLFSIKEKYHVERPLQYELVSVK